MSEQVPLEMEMAKNLEVARDFLMVWVWN